MLIILKTTAWDRNVISFLSRSYAWLWHRSKIRTTWTWGFRCCNRTFYYTKREGREYLILFVTLVTENGQCLPLPTCMCAAITFKWPCVTFSPTNYRCGDISEEIFLPSDVFFLNIFKLLIVLNWHRYYF